MSAGALLQYFQEEQQSLQVNQEILEKILDKVSTLEANSEIKNEDLIGYYNIKKLSEVIGLGSSTIYKKIKNNTFPRQIKLGLKSSGWCKKEVHFWISINTNRGYEYISSKGWSNIYTERYK